MTVVEAQVAHERGRPVVLVRPPAVTQVPELWGLVAPIPSGHGSGASPPVLIICADDAAAAEWAAATSAAPAAPTAPAAAAPLRVHAVTGLARTSRILKAGSAPILAGAVKDLTVLLERAALKLEAVRTVVVAWPEALIASESAPALDALLGEARAAARIVLSWNPAALRDFLDRHAPRALVLGPLPVDEAGRPLPAVGPARYAVVSPGRRAILVRDALDVLAATQPLVWEGGPIPAPAEPPDAVVCAALPTRAEFAALARLGEPTCLVTAAQLPYLRSVAAPLTPLALPSAADRAHDRVEELRAQVSRLIAATDLDAELALLEPLFERWDPAEVAAALLALARRPAAAAAPAAPTDPGAGAPARARVFVNIGRKDRAAAKDLVGALIREAGVAKSDIGRIDLRETFSLIELAADAAERAARGLTGVTIRGRRVLARLDRDT